MLFVITAEDLANPLGELVSTEQPLGLNYLAFAMNPLRFYRVEPRALGGQKAGHYAHSAPTALLDLAVVGSDPSLDELGVVPGGVVPDQQQGLLAQLFELVAAPPQELRGYGAHRAAIDEPQPSATTSQLGQIEPLTGEGLRVGVVLVRLLLEEAHRLSRLGPRMQARLLETALGNEAAPSSEKAGDGRRDFGFIRGMRRRTETWVPSNDG
jgi:hypothetical protein